MQWRLKGPTDTLMQARQVVELLFSEPPKDRKDHQEVVEAFSTAISSSGRLLGLTPASLIEAGFLLGYRYRVFLTKNNITVEEVADESTNNKAVADVPRTGPPAVPPDSE